ncbi:acyl-CoA dehydrogenase family protein [Clostridium sp.]
MVRDFAKTEIKPISEQIGIDREFLVKAYKKLGELGVIVLTSPKEFGGSGGDVLSYVACTFDIYSTAIENMDQGWNITRDEYWLLYDKC